MCVHGHFLCMAKKLFLMDTHEVHYTQNISSSWLPMKCSLQPELPNNQNIRVLTDLEQVIFFHFVYF